MNNVFQQAFLNLGQLFGWMWDNELDGVVSTCNQVQPSGVEDGIILSIVTDTKRESYHTKRVMVSEVESGKPKQLLAATTTLTKIPGSENDYSASLHVMGIWDGHRMRNFKNPKDVSYLKLGEIVSLNEVTERVLSEETWYSFDADGNRISEVAKQVHYHEKPRKLSPDEDKSIDQFYQGLIVKLRDLFYGFREQTLRPDFPECGVALSSTEHYNKDETILMFLKPFHSDKKTGLGIIVEPANSECADSVKSFFIDYFFEENEEDDSCNIISVGDESYQSSPDVRDGVGLYELDLNTQIEIGKTIDAIDAVPKWYACPLDEWTEGFAELQNSES